MKCYFVSVNDKIPTYLRSQFFIVLFSVLCSILIIIGSKTSIGSLFIALVIITYFIIVNNFGIETTNKYLLRFIIFSIPFPFLFQLKGKDAFTLSSALIFILIGLAVISWLMTEERKIITKGLLFILPGVLIINLTISLLINPIHLDQSLRYYFAQLSGIGLYFLVLSLSKKLSDCIIIIKIIQISLFIQVIIAFFQIKFPNLARIMLIPFGDRFETGYAPAFGEIVRSNAIVGDYELLAEMFLIAAMLTICLIYVERRKIYYLFLVAFIAGIIFTKTRSALLLFFLGLFIIYFLFKFYHKDNQRSFRKVIVVLLVGLILLFVIYPQQIDQIVGRLNTYFQSANRLSPEAVSRDKVWEIGYFLVKEPSLFGKGLFRVSTHYSWAVSFHSLYLTILFQIGLMGALTYVIFWITMLIKGWKALRFYRRSNNWHVIFFLLLAVILILVDGVKIEYFRYAHTIQFAWLVYATLAVYILRSEKNYENVMVSPSRA